MTGNSHDVDIELFDNSSDDEDQNKESQHESKHYEQARSPNQDLPEDFRSCNEAFTPRQSVEQDIFHEECKTSNENEGFSRPSSTLASSGRSSLSSQDGSSSATLQQPRTPSREEKKNSNDEEQSKGKHAMGHGYRAPPEPSIEVSMAEDSSPHSASPKPTKIFEEIYVGGLKVKREIDSDSARSPTLRSPTVETTAHASKKKTSQGSITLLDRFGQDVWLHRNEEEDMDEVRADEDSNYYVFGQGGFRVRLKEGQIQSDNNSQPFCICNGKKVNIHIVADRLRRSALQDPRPEDDGPITPRTEPIVNNKSDPLPSPLRNVTRPANIRTTSHKTRIQHSRTPWADIFTGVAEKSENATTYLTKRARLKIRSSTSQPAPPPQPRQQSTSRTTSRTSSASKSGLETGNSRETQGRRLPFLRQGSRVPPIANIKKRIMPKRQ
ncbi:hypothetical protein DL98DRAFT_530138 [Cadophora sp. DSE1049]|nr:hypothetical protein DL98DRAFT_530138 [Cadophora sp. DSE1049]